MKSKYMYCNTLAVRVDGEDEAQLELEIELVPCPSSVEVLRRSVGKLFSTLVKPLCITSRIVRCRGAFASLAAFQFQVGRDSMRRAARAIACIASGPGAPALQAPCVSLQKRMATLARWSWPSPCAIERANLGSLSRPLSRLSQVS